jgi:hypothetical protein
MEPPPRPDTSPWGAPASGPAPIPPRSGRGPVLVVAILLLLVGAGAVIVFLTQRGDGFPDSILGYGRLRGGAAETAEQFFESIRIGDLRIRAAVYTDGRAPRLVAVIYDNYPEGVDVSTLIRGASSGMEGSGGSVDDSSIQTAEGAGSRYACVEAGGPGFIVPGGAAEDGVLCVFTGDDVGLVITTHSATAIGGLQDVRAFDDAFPA